MNLSPASHFVFVPTAHDRLEGTLYELEPATEFSAPGFVMLPYCNPQNQPIAPAFYRIKKEAAFAEEPAFPEQTLSPVLLKARTSKERYVEQVKQLKKQIGLGNIYEINYCVEFFADNIPLDPVQVFRKLNATARAPYSALVKLGNDYILCASPELFLKKEGAVLSSKPIKGTTRRDADPVKDEALKQALYTSVKERTENVMAVDVARNDLSQVATKGSVTVNRLYNIESFETVHQMVSTVSCRLKEGITFDRIIRATFPMASMTGAPKLRAMQLTDTFEDFQRHYYSGAMGLVNEKDDFSLSVIIRSIFYNEQSKRLSIAVGGAITYLSDPETEYEECLLKAKGMLKALNGRLED